LHGDWALIPELAEENVVLKGIGCLPPFSLYESLKSPTEKQTTDCCQRPQFVYFCRVFVIVDADIERALAGNLDLLGDVIPASGEGSVVGEGQAGVHAASTKRLMLKLSGRSESAPLSDGPHWGHEKYVDQPPATSDTLQPSSRVLLAETLRSATVNEPLFSLGDLTPKETVAQKVV